MPLLKNQRHEMFAHSMAKGKTATEAYIAAGFKASVDSAGTLGPILLQRPEVAARIEELKGITSDAVTNAVIVTKQWLIAQATEVVRLAKIAGNYNAVNRALELLGREFKTFVEHKKLTVRHLDELNEDELEELLSEFEQSQSGIAGEIGDGRPN